MEEGEVRLTLNVLDLPGFGDQIDNSRSVIISQNQDQHMFNVTPCTPRCWHPLADHIEEQFQRFLQAETRISRLGGNTGGLDFA